MIPNKVLKFKNSNFKKYTKIYGIFSVGGAVSTRLVDPTPNGLKLQICSRLVKCVVLTPCPTPYLIDIDHNGMPPRRLWMELND